MANQALNVKIGADIKNLRDEMAKARGIIGNFTNQVDDIKSMLAGAFAVGSVVAFGKAAYDAAAQAVEGEQKLLRAVKGRADIQELLISQAERLHATTLFEDDEIVKQQALLAAMGRNHFQIMEVIQAATGMSAALGVDLDSAVKALNKSLEGSDAALGKLDPTLKGLTEEQLKHGGAIDLVVKKYGEYAVAARDDASSATKIFHKNFGDLTENIGRFLLPAVNGFIEAINLALSTAQKIGAGDQLNEFMSFRKAFAKDEVGLEKAKLSFIDQQNKTISEIQSKIQQARSEAGGFIAALTPWKDSARREEINKLVERQKILQESIKLVTDYNEEVSKTPPPSPAPTVAGKSTLSKKGKELLALYEKQKAQRLQGLGADPSAVLGADSAMAQAQKQLGDTTASIQEGMRAQMQKTISMAAQYATAVSDNFAMAASGQISYGQAIARSTIQIVNSLRDQAIAAIIAGTAKGPLSKINPIAAVALAAAASAGISALFGRLSSARGGGGFGGAGGGGEGGFAGTRLESLGMRVELQLAGDAGRMFKATITNQDRIDQRTKG